MSAYKRYSDKTKYMYFMIEDEKFFNKYMTIWGKVSTAIETNFNSELTYTEFYLQAEKRFHTKKLSMFIYTSNIDWFNL